MDDHKSRHDSVPAFDLQYESRSNISIFIHALHLLDLDLQPTWPDISISTFTANTHSIGTKSSTQSLQARIKATEWSLCHLFRLYSPAETTSRLSPHFPPTTPLKSKNLRQALFKWLTDLRSNGVLPRELVLRKTMFDECKGEKLEELLAKFAMVVLRKTLAKQEQNGGRIDQVKENMDVNEMVPLALAYRVSLANALRQRQELKEKVNVFSGQVAQLQRDMELAVSEFRSDSTNPAEGNDSLLAQNRDVVARQLKTAFANDWRWAEYLLKGTPDSSSRISIRNLPAWPFNEDWALTSSTEISLNTQSRFKRDGVDEPMHQLQSIASDSQTRLQDLSRLQHSLPEELGPEKTVTQPPASNVPVSIPASQPRFNRHQDLKLPLHIK